MSTFAELFPTTPPEQRLKTYVDAFPWLVKADGEVLDPPRSYTDPAIKMLFEKPLCYVYHLALVGRGFCMRIRHLESKIEDGGLRLFYGFSQKDTDSWTGTSGMTSPGVIKVVADPEGPEAFYLLSWFRIKVMREGKEPPQEKLFDDAPPTPERIAVNNVQGFKVSFQDIVNERHRPPHIPKGEHFYELLKFNCFAPPGADVFLKMDGKFRKVKDGYFYEKGYPTTVVFEDPNTAPVTFSKGHNVAAMTYLVQSTGSKSAEKEAPLSKSKDIKLPSCCAAGKACAEAHPSTASVSSSLQNAEAGPSSQKVKKSRKGKRKMPRK
ncbi:hypothetical protein CBOM_06537 [Ceraceosorus bombacis]|uniref:Uncharacterized protein n=1 Tax=Ceraceosorus bombacis TaxID=401625 RepID=A0A0P1BKZ6_9BASI|nr:hypothetical protein CBOM_06537 [Ceraceosorus bombacis]